MKRKHLFEWNDLDWLPQLFRSHITDFLHMVLSYYNIYAPALPILQKLLNTTQTTRITDFCSGSSGPIIDIHRALNQNRDTPITLTLTDKHPNALLQQVTTDNDAINVCPTSIDVLNTTAPMGCRTLFTAFHHFKPEQAKKILSDAVHCNDTIAIFEFTQNCPKRLLQDCLIPLLLWKLTPRIKPRHWQRWLFTYVIPIAPLLCLWDGLISNLRSYDHKELLQLANAVEANTYRWQSNCIDSGHKAFKLTYLIGYPVTHND